MVRWSKCLICDREIGNVCSVRSVKDVRRGSRVERIEIIGTFEIV